MKEGYEKYCRNGLCEGESRPKKYNLDEHCHEDLKDKCWYSGCQCPGERLIIPEEIQPQQIWNEEKMEGLKKLIQKQKLIDMMEQDKQLGLYEETKCYCGHTTTCDCGPETLEEAGEKLYPTDCSNWSIKVPLDERKAFIAGAKWQQENSSINALDFEIDSLKREIKVLKHQQERSYSEEEVYELIDKRETFWVRYKNTYSQNYISLREWFKQFKKK